MKKDKAVNKTVHLKKEDKQELMIKALQSNLLDIATSCKQVGISRSLYYQWLQDEAFKKKISELQEQVLDDIEYFLFREAEAGNATAIIFALKTKGKKRGWVEKQEVVQTQQIGSDDLDFDAMTKEDRDKFIELCQKYQITGDKNKIQKAIPEDLDLSKLSNEELNEFLEIVKKCQK